jgi:hypothetical protein
MVLVVLATALVLFAMLASTAQPSRAADTALTCFGRQPTMPGTIGTSGDDVLIGSSGQNRASRTEAKGVARLLLSPRTVHPWLAHSG